MDPDRNSLRTTLRDLENRLSALKEDYLITQRKGGVTCVNVLKTLGAFVELSVFVFLGTAMTLIFMLIAYAVLPL